ncbi:MAG TPA: transcriptional regulator [Acidimicrobiales bacterium]|nr:transcriptional regulator [Acidimicrobiales bacterium]
MATSTSGRLLRLLSLLQSRPYWGGPELADRLGVTTRTVRRDVTRLRDLGYPVEAAPGEAGGYRLGNGGDLPPLLLDDDEATAVAVALGVTTGGGGVRGIEEAALAALAKLDRLLPPHLRSRVASLRAATVTLTGPGGGGDEAADAEVLVALAQACDGHERVAIVYSDRAGRTSERRLEPYRLVATGRRWYLVAMDVERADWRTFRVDRVREVRPTGHRFLPVPDPPDAAAVVGEAISTAPYRYQAVIAFPGTAPDELARRIPPTVGTIRRAPRGDTGCVLRTGADRLDALAGHLIALGLDFEVREPPELRAHLAAVAARLAGTTNRAR